MTPSWFADAETHKARVLARLEKMTPDERQFSPAPSVWSAAQVVGHLIRVEELLITDWREAAKAAPATVKPGWQSGFIVGTINALMQTPLRVPTREFLEPTGSLDFADLSRRWQSVRKRIPSTLPADHAALWVVHPIFGPVSSPQMGSFLVAHLRHHWKHFPAVSGTRLPDMGMTSG